MSNKTNDQIAEELKQQLDTALDMKDFNRAKQINQDIIDIVGYGIEYEEDFEEDEDVSNFLRGER